MDPVAFIVNRFSPLLNGRCHLTNRDGSPFSPKAIGELGERIACQWLRAHGGKVLYRNFRAPRGGEVDIVAREGDVLLFTEVKTRTSETFARPLFAVNAKKQKLIRRGAHAWLKLLDRRDFLWRFDVLEIILLDGHPPKINRVEHAFESKPTERRRPSV